MTTIVLVLHAAGEVEDFGTSLPIQEKGEKQHIFSQPF